MMPLAAKFSITLVIFLAAVLAVTRGCTSRSGAMQTLRHNGELSTTTIYDNDTLYYAPNKGYMSAKEVDALESLSDLYIISVNQ